MRRYFESLRPADVSAIHSVPDGLFLVRVARAQYRWHKQLSFSTFEHPGIVMNFVLGALAHLQLGRARR